MEELSNFALMCYEEFVKNKVKRILELGCGQVVTLFFDSKGFKFMLLIHPK